MRSNQVAHFEVKGWEEDDVEAERWNGSISD